MSSEIVLAGYETTLSKWTKRGADFEFDTLDAQLIWHATLISDDLLKAQQKLATKRGVKIDPLCTDCVAFFIDMYTHSELKDFSMDKNSTWKIVLIGEDGVETSPVKIEKQTITPVETILYPHLSRWSKAYFVQFPKINLGHNPKLTIRSIAGDSTLEWKLK